MSASGAPSPAARDLDRLGRLTLVGSVSAALVATVAMGDAPAGAAANLVLVGLGLVVLGLMVLVGDRMPQARPTSRVVYFAVQLALVALIFAAQASFGSFGMAWLILMPLLAQGTLCWGWRGRALLAVAVVLLPAVHW